MVVESVNEWAFSMAQQVKNLTGEEGSISESGKSHQEEMATHSSILAWKIPWTEEHSGLQSMGLQKSWTRLSD